MLPLPFPCRNLTNQKQYITNEEKNQEIGGKKPPPAKKSYRRGQERRGFAPCIPATEPRRHWLDLPLWKTQWGACLGVANSANVSGTRRGAQGGSRLPTLPLRCSQGGLSALSPAYAAFSFAFVPIPPPPFPSGEGGDYRFTLPGAAAPGTPALNRLRHLQFPPYRYPAKGCLWLGAKTAEILSFGQSRQPRRGGTGGDGTIRRTRRRRLRWSSPPGQGEQVPPGFSSPPLPPPAPAKNYTNHLTNPRKRGIIGGQKRGRRRRRNERRGER